GASYTLNGQGSGTISFPLPSATTAQSQLLSGSKTLYVSADGNIVLGGALNGYDLLIGVRTFSGSASNASLQGTFYTGGFDNDASSLSQGVSYSDGLYGSVNFNGQGTA